MVVTTIPVGSGVGSGAFGVAVTPDGSRVYVANLFDNTVSVIDTAANAVVTTIPVGSEPAAYGQFIQPLIPAGQQASPTCTGKSVSALSNQFGDLTTAAATLGFPSVKALRATLTGFCGG